MRAESWPLLGLCVAVLCLAAPRMRGREPGAVAAFVITVIVMVSIFVRTW